MPAISKERTFQSGDPRLMVRWARRYAKSRTISFLVQWVFIVAMVTTIGLAAEFTNNAYAVGNKGLASVAVVFMVFSILALVWFSTSTWGMVLIDCITQWLYGAEGYAEYVGDQDSLETPWWITALGGGLVVHHIIGALLVSFDYLGLDTMQPLSAAYMAPFLIIMILHQRLGFWAWIWPICYALHGILLLTGAPIGFVGKWQLLDMAVPVFGYGLISIIVGHLYSRFALFKLKRLAQFDLKDAPPEVEEAEAP